ncbi:MAG: ribonuclease HI [Clostridia bacterium]|nr:ribonuclease HI [Clostridia bacterium]
MKEVTIYSDGACSGNPGPGGWGTIQVFNGHELELSAAEEQTTNNRMELLGAIMGLERLKEPCAVTLVSDSRYLCESINQGWVYQWEQKGWRKADKKPALNVDLWERMLAQLRRHRVTVQWVKGHDGHPYNERCDRLAVQAYLAIKK